MKRWRVKVIDPPLGLPRSAEVRAESEAGAVAAFAEKYAEFRAWLAEHESQVRAVPLE